MKNFAVVRSVDGPNHISMKELRTCTERMISFMPRAGIQVPPILVVHVSESVAALVGVERTGVIRHNCYASSSELSSYYEIWLVGEAGIGDYVLALQGIVNDIHGYNAFSGLGIPV